MENIIEVNGLKKYYGQVKAVDGMDFFVKRGSFFAFLGTNGAGKSTTIDILCTLLKPDFGSVVINGHVLGQDDAKIRADIGAVFQDGILDNYLSVRENLHVRAALYDKTDIKERAERAAQSAGCKEFLDRRYGKLSGGQKRRADIARALLSVPKVLFLDEPTTGLDPKTRKVVWSAIERLRKEDNVTVFLTTHYMEEAAEADYVTVIGKGKILAAGTPAALKEKYSRDSLRLRAYDKAALTRYLDEKHIEYIISGGAFKIVLENTKDALPILNAAEHLVSGFEVLSGGMDDAFINISGEELNV